MFRKFVLIFLFHNLTCTYSSNATTIFNRCELFDILENQSEEEAIHYLKKANLKINLSWFEQFIEFFRTNKINLEVTNSFGNTYLITSVTLGYTQLTEELLIKSANIHHKNHKGNTALIVASALGHTSIIRLLLMNGARVNDQNYSGETALVNAAQNGHLEAVNILLEFGANIDHQTKFMITPLMIASRNGHVSITQRLIEAGANVNLFDKRGINALIYAIMSGNPELVELILKNQPNINYEDNYGRNSLFHAISIGSIPIISLLIKAGANINEEYSVNFIPLVFASQLGHLNVVRFLLDNGARVKFQTFRKKAIDITSYHWKYPKITKFYEYYQKLLQCNNYNDLLELESEINGLKENNLIDPSQGKSTETEDWLIEKIRKFAKVSYIYEQETTLVKIYKVHKKCPVCFDEDEISQVECFGPANCNCYLCPGCTEYFLDFVLHKNKGEIVKCPGCQGLIQMRYFREKQVEPKKIEQVFIDHIHFFNSSQQHWVTCPTIDCTGGKIILPGESQYFHCGLCGFEKCLNCDENHRGYCTEAKNENTKTEQWIQFLLEQGCLPAPKEGHPVDPNDSTYYHGRYRPCYYCGLITERESNGSTEPGQCNSMTCRRCKKKWHWNYGSHEKHPNVKKNQEEVHDFQSGARQYEPLQIANF